MGKVRTVRAAVRVSATLAVVSLATAATAQTTPVIAFGDSISIGFREPGVDCNQPVATAKGYGEHLEDHLVDAGRTVKVFPRGICGEETPAGVSRIDDVLAEGTFEDHRGVVLLMEGTNDISVLRGVETIAWNLREMAAKAAAAGWTPVYSGVIPYGPPVNVQSRNERAEMLAESMEEFASLEKRPFADPFHDLMEIPNLFQNFYDSDGYHLNAAGYERLADSFVDPSLAALDAACAAQGPCVEDGPTLCLQDGRFQIDITWRTADEEGVGFGEPQTSDTGKVWFFGPDNLELLVKVLDARCFNDHFWVFYGALTDQQFTLTVTDKATCSQRQYFNDPGEMASVGDTAAFPAPCPDP